MNCYLKAYKQDSEIHKAIIFIITFVPYIYIF